MDGSCLYARTSLHSRDSFFYHWLIFFFLGVLAGLFAARLSVAQMDHALTELCGSLGFSRHAAVWPIFWSSAAFALLLVLLSQLPVAKFLIFLAVAGKSFCTAYAFGVFFLFQQQGYFDRMPLFLIVHAALLLPAYYLLALHCCRTRLDGRGWHWFKYRLLPVLLVFLYLFLIALLERMVW